MPYEHHYVRRAEFADTDMAGIVHFSNYLRYMESAEHDFFRSLGLPDYHPPHPGAEPSIAWPRVHVECDYLRALLYGDEVGIHVLVQERTATSLVLQYNLARLQIPEKPVVARGLARIACTRYDPTQQRLRTVVIPPAMAALLDVAPEERALEHRRAHTWLDLV